MTQQDSGQNSKYSYVNPNSKFFKLFLAYDIFMVFIIVFNLFCLGMNFFLMSNIGEWFFNTIHLPSVLEFYRTYLHPWVITTEAWFIIFLIIELVVRWLLSIVQKHHARWWFFPFIHWYEILAIIPHLRFLRLFRAGIIAYRLYELGYKVIPDNIRIKAMFYYRVIMEELSDRVVITVIDGIRHELETSSTHKKIIHDLVDHHRELFTITLASMLQESLAKALQQQQPVITQKVGIIVNQAIEDTPELTQLLRLIPIVGGRIEQQIQSIGQRLGENISAGLIEPFTVGSPNRPNENYQLIAEKVSELNIDNQYLEELVESVVFESLEAIRKQVKVKQWQQTLQEYDQLDKKSES
ncbi:MULTISPECIES: preprotein translocase subunit SecA [unclassified Acinetobacter]|uniref:preprotein translocase subunit SecA n=1 Tax=unclassified Acinetobacter TaxID=196816 RepID=UPI002448E052|nr:MULTISPECIES: preprotein translocase subunit SecA [unclassified Acinetobacter]MDH0032895.1 preprotein translocase subunit SecA [Acinetobacter sp. GD04021]MDH0888301.1 preprotein translocase subunit SecA [Acinetobacter sp. GD03873]MDH1084686.1 preprotein translocase subunit SecA [Acinetobacter sp. GD03983]MDH2191617.1 preprotein translocase subunit SecA [Acinetobacter sp. GD03645]MDH2205228.1 preprotein translocase subunit SecA [Acinetobacter sp. GD03647]